jgi:predicted nucleotidyltransferase
MVTQSIALKIAQDYLREVRALGIGVQRAILFGSFAHNQQHLWSDIDLALFADDFIGLAALDKDRFRSLHVLPQFMSIETHTFPSHRLYEDDPFVEEIKRTGVEVE